jgi:sterol desaturase/sphingolipid hydroxylase (fatty acid hydroxylase superfamily)
MKPMGNAPDKTSLRGASGFKTLYCLACVGLLLALALPVLNSLMLAGYLPYGPNTPKDKFPEPQTTIVLSVLGVMVALALVGGYAINSGTEKLQGWLFTGILVFVLAGLAIFFLNFI